MKSIIMVLVLSLVSGSAFADISRNTARKQAFDFVSQIFWKMSDQNSDFSVSDRAEDSQYFTFDAVAQIDSESCYVEVFVSKRTGEAFRANDPICK